METTHDGLVVARAVGEGAGQTLEPLSGLASVRAAHVRLMHALAAWDKRATAEVLVREAEAALAVFLEEHGGEAE